MSVPPKNSPSVNVSSMVSAASWKSINVDTQWRNISVDTQWKTITIDTQWGEITVDVRTGKNFIGKTLKDVILPVDLFTLEVNKKLQDTLVITSNINNVYIQKELRDTISNEDVLVFLKTINKSFFDYYDSNDLLNIEYTKNFNNVANSVELSNTLYVTKNINNSNKATDKISFIFSYERVLVDSVINNESYNRIFYKQLIESSKVLDEIYIDVITNSTVFKHFIDKPKIQDIGNILLSNYVEENYWPLDYAGSLFLI